MSAQLVLPLRLQANKSFSNFYAGKNTQLLAFLQQVLHGKAERSIYVWGKEGCGKSHLLQACCQQAWTEEKSVFYFSFREYAGVDVLQDLEYLDLVALDDVDALARKSEWEIALMNLYNRCVEKETILLLSGRTTARELPVTLNDLRSRMMACLPLHVEELGDEEKIMALRQSALERGLNMPEDVARFLLTRCDRTWPALLRILDRLDYASLQHQRRLTIPFVKTVLEI